ncbi:hypothetical protein [Desulfogranum japonicum]|nr:hypothetical protein [Desulfogranum japonicum]
MKRYHQPRLVEFLHSTAEKLHRQRRLPATGTTPERRWLSRRNSSITNIVKSADSMLSQDSSNCFLHV